MVTLLTVLDAGLNQHKIRLTGTDAPESGQPFGTVPGDNLGRMVFGRHVTVTYDGLDRYGRVLGKVLISGQDTNLLQILAGLAWHYKAYADEQNFTDGATYAAAEIDARSKGRGLWADAHPIPPWEWRKGERTVTANMPSVTTAGGCAARPTCGELATCYAVTRYVRQCGARGLDGDGDGVSCESLCR